MMMGWSSVILEPHRGQVGIVSPSIAPFLPLDIKVVWGYTIFASTTKADLMKQDDITVAQIAKLLGVTPRAVQHMIKRGEFPNARQIPGGRTSPFLVPQSDLEAYLKKKRPQPPKG
jgi:excisionase family DNA binding protein